MLETCWTSFMGIDVRHLAEPNLHHRILRHCLRQALYEGDDVWIVVATVGCEDALEFDPGAAIARGTGVNHRRA